MVFNLGKVRAAAWRQRGAASGCEIISFELPP
jgi:hypothetical protein